MSFSKGVLAAFALSIAIGAPALATSMKATPKPMMKTPHQCRDAKGHFVKGKYLKCPNGTHAA
jgi:hypothetical protein